VEKLKVLIVEDECLLAMDLQDTVERSGHNVIGQARNCAQAMVLAARAGPNVAFVDLNLTDGPTGPEIARRLGAEHHVLVVFLTGSPEQIPHDFCGALGFLRKPSTHSTLGEMLQFLVDHRAGATAVPPREMTLGPVLRAL
jgi:DNA-binding response OmpR family regulator